MSIKPIFLCLALNLAAPSPAFAEPVDPGAKLFVKNDVLIFDTQTGQKDGEIEARDADRLRDVLRANPSVTTLSLNSTGGSVWAGDEIAHIVVDFDLDTVVDGQCSSACVTIFLGGNGRRMTRGSRIGLHSRWWAAEDVQAYYEEWKMKERWDTPFDFASWIYEDTQAEVYEGLSYTLSRGVDPAFAIEMQAPRSDMWYPSRAELERAGVLRERLSPGP